MPLASRLAVEPLTWRGRVRDSDEADLTGRRVADLARRDPEDKWVPHMTRVHGCHRG